MYNKTREAEDSLACRHYFDEIGLVVSVFWGTTVVTDALGQEKPDGVSEEDVLIASDLARTVRIYWNSSDDGEKLYWVVDNIIDLHPEIIPWLQGFVQDGEEGEERFFNLMQYAHRLLFQ